MSEIFSIESFPFSPKAQKLLDSIQAEFDDLKINREIMEQKSAVLAGIDVLKYDVDIRRQAQGHRDDLIDLRRAELVLLERVQAEWAPVLIAERQAEYDRLKKKHGDLVHRVHRALLDVGFEPDVDEGKFKLFMVAERVHPEISETARKMDAALNVTRLPVNFLPYIEKTKQELRGMIQA